LRFFFAESGDRCVRGIAAARQERVIHSTVPPHSTDSSDNHFWLRILRDDSLQGCAELEKILAGCEIIAALDDLDLLDAA
jgi:hypothetical protein